LLGQSGSFVPARRAVADADLAKLAEVNVSVKWDGAKLPPFAANAPPGA